MCRIGESSAKRKKVFHDRLDSEEEEETAPEKRLRLAKEYLSKIEEEGKSNLFILCPLILSYCTCVIHGSVVMYGSVGFVDSEP